MCNYFYILFLFILVTHPLYPQRTLENITKEDDLKQFIYQTAPDEDAFVAVQRLAKHSIDMKDWNGAVQIFQTYKEWFPEMNTRFQQIIELLQAPLQNLTVTNLKGINTEADEYFPVITIDGSKLYFTGSNREGGKGGEDIFIPFLKMGTGTYRKTLVNLSALKVMMP